MTLHCSVCIFFRHKNNLVLNYALFGVPAWKGKVWSRNRVLARDKEGLGLILPHVSYDPGPRRRITLTGLHTHKGTDTQTWQMAKHHGGDWHSLSHTSLLSLLNTQPTDTQIYTHTYTHACMNTHIHWGSETQDEARLTAGMSCTALVTFLAVEINYLRLLSNKKTHLSLKHCDSLPWISMSLETWVPQLKYLSVFLNPAGCWNQEYGLPTLHTSKAVLSQEGLKIRDNIPIQKQQFSLVWSTKQGRRLS